MFYLKYHLYREYFPLIALTTYAKVMAEKSSLAFQLFSSQLLASQLADLSDSRFTGWLAES